MDAVRIALRKPADTVYTFRGTRPGTSVALARTGEDLEITITRRNRTVSRLSLYMPDKKYDKHIGLLIFLVVSGLGSFKLNFPSWSPLSTLNRQLRRQAPFLVSESPVDMVITGFYMLHEPETVILPAGEEYVRRTSKYLNLAAGELEWRHYKSPDDPLSKDDYKILLSTGINKIGYCFACEKTITERLLIKYYPETARVVLGSGVYDYRDFWSLFQAEPKIFLLDRPGLLGREMTRLIRKHTGGRVKVSFERLDLAEYSFKLTLEDDRPIEIPMKIKLADLAGLVFNLPSEEMILSELVRLGNGDEIRKLRGPMIPLKRYKKKLYFHADTGRAVVLHPDGGEYWVHRDFRSLQEHLWKEEKREPDEWETFAENTVPTEHVRRLGLDFFGSEETMKAVYLTGCIVCEKYELLNDRLAIAKDDYLHYFVGFQSEEYNMILRIPPVYYRYQALYFLLLYSPSVAYIDTGTPNYRSEEMMRKVAPHIPGATGLLGLLRELDDKVGIIKIYRPVINLLASYDLLSVIEKHYKSHAMNIIVTFYPRDEEELYEKVKKDLPGASLPPNINRKEILEKYGFKQTKVPGLYKNGLFYIEA